MNPHFRHAQRIPGINAGSRQGIIEGIPISRDLLDAVWMLHRLDALSDAEVAAFREWVSSLLNWLRTHPFGLAEAERPNNHGTWYGLQLAAMASFLGRDDLLAEIWASAHRRLEQQIEPDGRQPEELRRTKSFDYSVYNLDAWFRLATLAQRHGVDLWHATPGDDATPRLRRALDHLLAFAAAPDRWPEEQLGGVQPASLAPLLLRAAAAYDAPAYAAAAARLRPETDSARRLRIRLESGPLPNPHP